MKWIDPYFSEREQTSSIPMHWDQKPIQEQEKSMPNDVPAMFIQAKKMLDHLGGLEGVIRVVKQVHQVVQQFQEVAPLIQLVWQGMRSKDDSSDSNSEFDSVVAPDRTPSRTPKKKPKRRPRSTKTKNSLM